MEAISIIRGRAGGVNVAIASDAIARMIDDDAHIVHLAAVLGSLVGPLPQVGECRALVVAGAHGANAVVRVDEPVRFDTLTRANLLADAPALPARCIPFALGFARVRGELVLLLDAKRIVPAVHALVEHRATISEEIQ